LPNLPKRFFFASFFLTFVFAAWPSAADAQQSIAPGCPIDGANTLPVDRQAASKELLRIDRFVDQCRWQAEFFAYRGALLLSLGRYEGAAESLERALLLAPEAPGVQLDYAQALAQMGQRSAASALLEGLLQRPDLHPRFRAFLDAERYSLLEPRWVLGLKAMTQLGFESNLNSAPSSGFFTVTAPSGPVFLELQPGDRPKSGPALLSQASASGWRDLGGGQGVGVVADLRGRVSGHGSGFLQADFSGQRRFGRLNWLENLQAHPSGRVGLTSLDFGGRPIFQSARTEFLLDGSAFTCRGRGGGAYERRIFPQSRMTDGDYFGLIAGTHCYFGEYLLGIQASLGEDRAVERTRAGGNQRRIELGSSVYRRFERLAVNVSAGLFRGQDQKGYSDLLNSGERRWLQRRVIRAEASWPMAESLEWVLSGEWIAQDSNLVLFALESKALYFGVRATLY
jgi:tetratricopeptide (TPR) repeat protein